MNQVKNLILSILQCKFLDLAARGIDIIRSHAINDAIPQDLPSLFTVGRTGCNGLPGVAITLINQAMIQISGELEKWESALCTESAENRGY